MTGPKKGVMVYTDIGLCNMFMIINERGLGVNNCLRRNSLIREQVTDTPSSDTEERCSTHAGEESENKEHG